MVAQETCRDRIKFQMNHSTAFGGLLIFVVLDAGNTLK